MSFSISLNLRPSVPLPDFANLTLAVNDINENMINNIIPTIKEMVNALVNVFIVAFGIADIIMVALLAPLAIASILAYMILVSEENSPVAEATSKTMTAGMMKYITSKINALIPMTNCFT